MPNPQTIIRIDDAATHTLIREWVLEVSTNPPYAQGQFIEFVLTRTQAVGGSVDPATHYQANAKTDYDYMALFPELVESGAGADDGGGPGGTLLTQGGYEDDPLLEIGETVLLNLFIGRDPTWGAKTANSPTGSNVMPLGFHLHTSTEGVIEVTTEFVSFDAARYWYQTRAAQGNPYTGARRGGGGRRRRGRRR